MQEIILANKREIMNLVIIEGVGKKDTIKKYLGNGYEVIATKGHVRDLPVHALGINVLDNFKPMYKIMPDKDKIVEQLKSKSAKCENIYLATDPDREGEAISWHLCNILGLDENSPVRIEFNEISKNAVNKALKEPRSINKNLVDAQQARRVLDRLVGYKISPIICKKIQPKLSAGRVQSVCLKLIVDRENQIRNFKSEEYWTLNAKLYPQKEQDLFNSLLIKVGKAKAKIVDKESMDNILEELKNNDFVVKSVKKSTLKIHPSPPYTTSTLQQDALNKLGMSIKRTSVSAQNLYEGVEIGNEGKVALVTYIRTDSVRISPAAMSMAKDYINVNFGKKYLPTTPNYYKVKKSAQDAHEAIRPISLDRTPESVKKYLTSDNYKLYKLVYNKFLASQMSDSIFNSVTIEVENGKYIFKSSGKTPVFDGFMKLYNNSKKSVNDEGDEDELNAKLPELIENQKLKLKELIPAQKFTKPPARFSEASLIKEMEDKGIGRPATYTPTILILHNRKYMEKEGKFLKPTELGEKVNELIEKYFSKVINIKFTAEMEDKLDEIANSGIEWHKIVKDFYDDFSSQLIIADKDALKIKIPPKETDKICPQCNGKMVIRTGKYGEFLACSNYPNCKFIESLNKVVGICPKCGKNVLEKRSKKGTIYYGCEDYKNCDFISWEIPLNEKCPQCESYLTSKIVYGKLRKKCSKSDCNYTVFIQLENDEQKK